jgi:hypothetical protein
MCRGLFAAVAKRQTVVQTLIQNASQVFGDLSRVRVVDTDADMDEGAATSDDGSLTDVSLSQRRPSGGAAAVAPSGTSQQRGAGMGVGVAAHQGAGLHQVVGSHQGVSQQQPAVAAAAREDAAVAVESSSLGSTPPLVLSQPELLRGSALRRASVSTDGNSGGVDDDWPATHSEPLDDAGARSSHRGLLVAFGALQGGDEGVSEDEENDPWGDDDAGERRHRGGSGDSSAVVMQAPAPTATGAARDGPSPAGGASQRARAASESDGGGSGSGRLLAGQVVTRPRSASLAPLDLCRCVSRLTIDADAAVKLQSGGGVIGSDGAASAVQSRRKHSHPLDVAGDGARTSERTATLAPARSPVLAAQDLRDAAATSRGSFSSSASLRSFVYQELRGKGVTTLCVVLPSDVA